MAIVDKNAFYSTGRRKQAVARVWMMPGSGKILINRRDIDDYFGRATSKMILRQPLELTETINRYDIFVNVAGGGLSGQADAIQHGITRSLEDYFGRETSRMVFRQALELTETSGRFDVFVNVSGGGLSGQADAIRHGMSRVLIKIDPAFRGALKKAGYLTRDARQKERKKYGQRGARARFQFSKR